MSAGRSAKDVIILLAVILVAVGGIAGFGFFQEEVSGYLRLQAWNTSPLVEKTREFVQAAAADDAAKVEGMIAANAQDLKLVKEGGENYLTVRRYGGPDKHTLKVLFPTANPSYEKPNVILKGGGMVSVVASYPDAHAMDFRWDNTPQGWKVKALSRMKDGE